MDGGTGVMAELTRGQILRNPEVYGVGDNPANIRLFDNDESAYVEIKSPGVLSSSYSLTFPPNDGNENQFLKTDGSGNLSWETVTAEPGGSLGAIQFNSENTFGGATGLTTDGTHLTVRSAGEIRLNETDNVNYVGFKAPSSVGGNRTYTLPDTIGSAGQVLGIAGGRTDNAATLVWLTSGGGGTGTPGGVDTYVQFNDAADFGGDEDFTYNKTTNLLYVQGGVNLGSGSSFQVNSTNILSSTTLGSTVVNSSLTSVGTLLSLQVDNINIDGNVISSTNTNGVITLTPAGSGTTQSSKNFELLGQSSLVLRDTDDSNSVSIRSNASVLSNYTITLPSSIGSVDEILAFDGTGNASFVANYRNINFIIDGGTSVISTGVQGYVQVPLDCTIIGWSLLGNQAGLIVVDIWKLPLATDFPPTVANSITANAPPTIAGTPDLSATSSTLTGWTTTVSDGDVLAFNVNSVTDFRKITVVLKLRAR
jgi:hypothetical protein